MAEISQFWEGQILGDATRARYDSDEWTTMYGDMFGSRGENGVLWGTLNELEVTVTGANAVQVDTGAALVRGRWYYNDSAKPVNVPNSVGAWREDGIVLRCDWTAQTIRAVRKENPSGDGAAWDSSTMLTQAYGTTWEIPLAAAYVTNVGAVTVTDLRQRPELRADEFWGAEQFVASTPPSAPQTPTWDDDYACWQFSNANSGMVRLRWRTPLSYHLDQVARVWVYWSGQVAIGAPNDDVYWAITMTPAAEGENPYNRVPLFIYGGEFSLSVDHDLVISEIPIVVAWINSQPGEIFDIMVCRHPSLETNSYPNAADFLGLRLLI